MKQLRMYLVVISAAVAVGFFGCAGSETGGGDPAVDTTSGPETATGDGLPEPDVLAGIDISSGDDTMSGDDTGLNTDAGQGDASPQPDIPTYNIYIDCDTDGPQHRGPVVLRYTLELAELSPYEVTAEWRSDVSQYSPCTSLTGYSSTGPTGVALVEDGKFVWDSMTDIQEDLPDVEVRLRVTAENGDAGVMSLEPFSLYNDPARERMVLITHDINGDNRVRQLTWTHGVGLGGVGGDPEGLIHTVAESPRRVTFSPNGCLAAVVEEGTEYFRILQISLDTGTIQGHSTESAAGLYPVDMEFAGDGADLYIVHSSPNPDGGVYRMSLRPAYGFPGGGEPQQIHSQYVPGDIEVLPEGRGLALLAADPGGNMEGMHLVILSLDGEVLSETTIGPEGSIARDVAASPDGQWLLATYFNLFAEGQDRVVLIALDAEGKATIVNDVGVSDPEEPAWTSNSLTALVTEAMNDQVTGLAVDGGTLIKGNSFTLGLASRIAHTRWGPDQDIFLVTTVSASSGKSGLAVVTVGEDGTVTNTGTYELGNGIDKIPGDVAIQP